MKDLIRKIKKCDDPEMLLSLEEDFNKIGLSLQQANSGKLLLCKIVDGRPVVTKSFDDYVPIGRLAEELTEKAINRVIGFVVENNSKPATIDDSKNIGNYGLYGSSFHDNATADSRLIDAIAEWINE